MANYIINGGNKLQGKIETNSAKNSAVAILCATPMLTGRTVLTNVPVIEEVKRIIEILISIGLQISWIGEKEVEIINRGNINLDHLDKQAFCRTRSALLLMSSLSSRFKKYSLPHAGGCQLGKRTVNPYLIAMEHLGYKVKQNPESYEIEKQKAKGATFTMYESSDTGTENTIMAALTIPGTTEINFASSNYMVQDFCLFLKAAGANIQGIGTHKLKISGNAKLKPVVNYPIMPDPIESMALIAVSIVTDSKLTITGCPIEFLNLELEKLKVMGQKMKISQPYKSANKFFDLVDIEITPSKLTALPDKIYGRPFPGLNLDNLPLFIPILAKAHGQTLVHDWAYENRAIYYTELNKLGANIMLHDPHRVTVTGPTNFKPAEIMCPPALRPSINLLICMLGAKGKSILRDSYAIDRGYENIYERLNQLGADIQKID